VQFSDQSPSDIAKGKKTPSTFLILKRDISNKGQLVNWKLTRQISSLPTKQSYLNVNPPTNTLVYTSKVNNDFASDFFQQANEIVLGHEEQNFCEGFYSKKNASKL